MLFPPNLLQSLIHCCPTIVNIPPTVASTTPNLVCSKNQQKMQTKKIVIAKKHVSQFSKHKGNISISENEPAIVQFLLQNEIHMHSNFEWRCNSEYATNILYFSNATVEQEKILGTLEHENLFAAWLQPKKDVNFLAVYNTSANEIIVERTLLKPELFGNLFHMDNIAKVNTMKFTISKGDTCELFDIAKSMVSCVRFEVKQNSVAVYVSFVSAYRVPIYGCTTMHRLEFDAVKMEMKKEYYEYQAYSLKGSMNILNSVLAISCETNEHMIPVNATMSMHGWYIEGDYTNDLITNFLIIPTTVWQQFLGILGVNPVFTLKEWTIRCTEDGNLSTNGKLVFVTPAPLEFAGKAVLVSNLDISKSTITMHCSFGMNSITLLENGTFTANYHHSRKFLLSEQLLQQFGYSIQCNEFYRHLIGSELNCTLHGKLNEKNVFSIETLSNAYVTIAPQKIVTFVFQSLWEITIPQRTLTIKFGFTSSKLQYDDTKMSYSSWKFSWLFHSASTIVCRTGSSTTSILTAANNINMTVAQLFGIAKRILPSSIASTIASSYLTSIHMNIVTKELEAKNEHAMITWCNASDSFACKMGPLLVTPKYDTTKKLLPVSPFSDVTFAFK